MNDAGPDLLPNTMEKDREFVKFSGTGMSGSESGPSLGLSGEPVVRKRGRPKKVRMSDDDDVSRKRQKMGGGGPMVREPIALSIGSMVEESLTHDAVKNRGDTNDGDQQELSQTGITSPNVIAGLWPDSGKDIDNYDGKGSAWEVVLQVHGVRIPAKGGAAKFPGETGRGGVDSTLCLCCEQPEITRQTIVCDGCEHSFHIDCVKLSFESATDLDDWLCPSCSVTLGVPSDSRGICKLGQHYLEAKLGRVVDKISQIGGGGNGGTGKTGHERKLDLDVPADVITDGFDPNNRQNGLAEGNSRQEPSFGEHSSTIDLKEGQAIRAEKLPTITQLEVLSGSGPKHMVSDIQLPGDALPWSPNFPARLVDRSNAKLAVRTAELTDLDRHSLSDGIEVQPKMVKSKVSTGREEFEITTNNKLEKCPEKLAIVSKELGKVAERKSPDEKHELAEVSGSKRIPTQYEFAEINESKLSDNSAILVNVMENKLFDSSGILATLRESKLLNSSPRPRVSRSDDMSEELRLAKLSDSKLFSITEKLDKDNPSMLVDTTHELTQGTWAEKSETPTKPTESEQVRYTTKPLKEDEGKPFGPSLKASKTGVPEGLKASLQEVSSGVRRTLPAADPGLLNDANSADGYQPAIVNCVDLAAVVYDKSHSENYNTMAADSTHLSSEDLHLKKVGEETLQQLKDFVIEKHGIVLSDGWEVEVRKRRNERHLDKYYISPERQRFRSRIEVMRHLGLCEGPPRGKSESQQGQAKDWFSVVQTVEKEKEEASAALQLPFKCGDLTVESLGVVDQRPGFRDDNEIWPVGYRSTWHDSATASFCISEIVDNGAPTPIFRVTRKFCPTFLVSSNVPGVETLPNCNGDVIVGGKSNGNNLGMNNEEKTAFLSRPLFRGFSSVADREDREALKALLGDLGDSIDELETEDGWECSESRDAIGEFTVEGRSTCHAWRLFAEEFVKRCQRTPWVVDLLPDICHHFKCENLPSQPGAPASPGLTFSESPDLGCAGLLEKLAQDRFGLSESLVKSMIEALPHSDNSVRYKSIEQKIPCSREDDSVVTTVSQSRVRAREKARRHRKAPEILTDVPSGVFETARKADKNETIASAPCLGRPPPPAGQPLSRRLPAELVGDVLQIWEFLSRFAEVIGQTQPPMLADLEEGLICGTAIPCDSFDQRRSFTVNSEEIGGINGKFGTEPSPVLASGGDVSITIPASRNGYLGGCSQPVMKATTSSQPSCSLLGQGLQQASQDGLRGIRLQDDRKSTPANIPAQGHAVESINPNPKDGQLNTDDGLSAAKLVLSSGFATAGSIHIPLINYLLSDLQAKVCGPDEVLIDAEESKPLKRGRKRIRDSVIRAVLGREKLSESFCMNLWTWPEIARRYMISVSRLTKIGEMAEDNTEECMKILRCIQGDGGVLCGALDGVAGMEVDAQLLAEAEKELSTGSRENEETPIPATPPQMTAGKDIVADGKVHDGSGETALWVKILDPIAKLPTNVGSRIRNRVRDALEADPPDWAVELLTHSISKEVYKGNASGPTKRAVMEVLSKYRGEDPKIRKSRKLRKRVVPSPEVVMQRCRIVLRQVAAADTDRIVSSGIGTMITNFYESAGETLLPRPLDFRAIDLRLGAGAYGTSPAAFAADVRQIWKNVSSVYGSDSEEFKATTVLSDLFESLYSKQVIVFQGGVDNTGTAGGEGKNTGNCGEPTKQNATGEQPSGQDAGETVKAPWEDDSCRICGIDDDHDNVLLCDACDAEYHIYCLNPPLSEVPEGNWYCSSCVAVDKGFLEAPPVPEAVLGTKALDKQDEQLQPKGVGTEDVPEKELLQSGDSSAHEPLQSLAMKLAETDYWHLSLAERVCFLKCLCDQALETLKLRIHMEETMDVAMDLQQKLRTLLADRRRHAELEDARLDNARDTTDMCGLVQSEAVKIRRQQKELGNEIISDVEQTTLAGSKQQLDSVGVGFGLPIELSISETTAVSGEQEVSNLKIQDNSSGKHAMDGNSTSCAATGGNLYLCPDAGKGLGNSMEKCEHDIGSGNTSITRNECARVSKDVISSSTKEGVTADLVIGRIARGADSEVAKASLPHGLVSPLDSQIGKVVSKLMTVNMRRDLLGKDDLGREYWVLYGCKVTPWLAAEAVDAEEMEDGVRLVARPPEGQTSGTSSKVAQGFEKTEHEMGRNPGFLNSNDSTLGPAEITYDREAMEGEEMRNRKQQDEHRWSVYSDEGLLDQLIGWLSTTSSQEKALKSTLQQWRPALLIHKCDKGEICKEPSNLCSMDTFSGLNKADLVSHDLRVSQRKRVLDLPVLRASRILEWKYGRFSSSTLKETWTPVVEKKRGRKKKIQSVAGVSRCKCLEPIWLSRCHCMLCHNTFQSAAELEAHTKGTHCVGGGDNTDEQVAGRKTGKKGVQTAKCGLSSKPPDTPSPEHLAGIITVLPDLSKMPFIVHDSTQDRINQIGLIADKRPTFAPGLSVAPAFDPSLMILDSPVEHPLSQGVLCSNQQLLDTLAVGGTSCINHMDVDNSEGTLWVLTKSSEDLPGKSDGASDSKLLLMDPQDPLGVTLGRVGLSGSVRDSEKVEPLHLADSKVLKTLSNDPDLRVNSSDFAIGSSGFSVAGKAKAGGRLFQVTGKQLVIPEASLLPLNGRDLDLLKQLKIKVLDIEAVLTSDMLEMGRGSASRRQEWRSFVKSAKSIYMMVQATILLEQMVCADFLRGSWCYWSSFSAAAKTATLSSLFLRICALDAAILYELSPDYTGAEASLTETKQGKKEKEKEDKKKGGHLKVTTKKRRKDEVTI